MSDLLLARVRKLLAKAEDPACTSAEAEAFTAKATELIAKYGVDRALLAAQDPAIDPVGDRIVPLDAPYALDKAGLLAAVAVPLGCRVVRRTRDGVKVHLFGHDADLERVELLFTSLLVQAAHGLAAVRRRRRGARVRGRPCRGSRWHERPDQLEVVAVLQVQRLGVLRRGGLVVHRRLGHVPAVVGERLLRHRHA